MEVSRIYPSGNDVFTTCFRIHPSGNDMLTFCSRIHPSGNVVFTTCSSDHTDPIHNSLDSSDFSAVDIETL